MNNIIARADLSTIVYSWKLNRGAQIRGESRLCAGAQLQLLQKLTTKTDQPKLQ